MSEKKGFRVTYFTHGRCGFDLDYDRNEVIVWMGDVPCSNATLDVILKWIRKVSQGIPPAHALRHLCHIFPLLLPSIWISSWDNSEKGWDFWGVKAAFR